MSIHYSIKSPPLEHQILERTFHFKYPWWEDPILPGKNAPVICGDGPKLMRFLMIHSWAKKPQLQFTTHNACIESVLEDVIWKRAFADNHCLVLMDSFTETPARGDWKGNKVKFVSPKTLCAAGIYDRWVHQETDEEIESFSILTTKASDYVSRIGQDRQPLFLMNEELQKQWVDNRSLSAEAWQKTLLELAQDFEFWTQVEKRP